MGFWYFSTGMSFLAGAGLVIGAVIVSSLGRCVWNKIGVYLLFFAGAALVLVSGTPITWWLKWLWLLVLVIWLGVATFGKELYSKSGLAVKCVAILLSCVAILGEWPYYRMPQLPAGSYDKMYIIGDSITTGVGGPSEETYSKLLRKRHNIEIVNLAIAGATASDAAIRQAPKVKNDKAIVLLEIGGNDLLRAEKPYQFEMDLDTLLSIVVKEEKLVVMLELPVLPWQSAYGKIQRKLSKKYGVILIPKRFFVSILAPKDATTDGIHLSEQGHKLMADGLWEIIGTAMKY